MGRSRSTMLGAGGSPLNSGRTDPRQRHDPAWEKRPASGEGMSTAAGRPASTNTGPSARTLGVAVAAGIAPLAWGTTFFVTDTFLPPDRPLFGAVVRALPIGFVFLLAVRQLPRGHWWWKTAVLSLLNVGAFFP